MEDLGYKIQNLIHKFMSLLHVDVISEEGI